MPPTRKFPTAEKDATGYTGANGVAREASTSATTLNESVDVDGNQTSYAVALENSAADEKKKGRDRRHSERCR